MCRHRIFLNPIQKMKQTVFQATRAAAPPKPIVCAFQATQAAVPPKPIVCAFQATQAAVPPKPIVLPKPLSLPSALCARTLCARTLCAASLVPPPSAPPLHLGVLSTVFQWSDRPLSVNANDLTACCDGVLIMHDYRQLPRVDCTGVDPESSCS